MNGEGVQLRPAIALDEAALVGFMRQLREDDPDEGPFDEARSVPAMRRLVADPSLGRVWMIEVDRQPAGYVALTLGFSIESGGVSAFVDELFVARGHRRRGVGTRTLELVIAAARAIGVAVLLLEVTRFNDAARRVYSKIGFAERPHQTMTMRLN